MPAKRRLAAPVVVTLALLPSCATRGSGPTGPSGGGSHVEHHEDGSCWLIEDPSCPPDATCNPPPPQPVDCATGAPVKEPEPTESAPDAGVAVIATPEPPTPEASDGGSDEPRVTYDRRDDGTCWEYVDVTCPPQVRCNPPPPRRVDCTTHQPTND